MTARMRLVRIILIGGFTYLAIQYVEYMKGAIL